MNYGKAVSAVLATALAALVPLLADGGTIDAVEWVNVVILGLGACAVFAAPNVPGARYVKLVLAVLTAVATLLVSLIADGISTTDWMQLALAALGAMGVHAAPYAPLYRDGEVAGSFPKHAKS